MLTIEDLKNDTYYLLQLQEQAPIQLVSVILRTRQTLLLRSYLPVVEDFLKSKSDPIYKLIEELDEETSKEFESIYLEEEDKAEEEMFEFEEDQED
jgi:hypothetical protein